MVFVVVSCVVRTAAPSDSISFVLTVEFVSFLACLDFRAKATTGVCTANGHGREEVYMDV